MRFSAVAFYQSGFAFSQLRVASGGCAGFAGERSSHLHIKFQRKCRTRTIAAAVHLNIPVLPAQYGKGQRQTDTVTLIAPRPLEASEQSRDFIAGDALAAVGDGNPTAYGVHAGFYAD